MKLLIMANLTKPRLDALVAKLIEFSGPCEVEFQKIEGDAYSLRCTDPGPRMRLGKIMDDFMKSQPEEEPPVLTDEVEDDDEGEEEG